MIATKPNRLAGRGTSRGPAPGRGRRLLSAALFAPTVIMVGIFVYGFIAFTIRVSLTRGYTPLNADMTLAEGLGDNYAALMATPRFQMDLRNILLLTAFSLFFAITLGMVLALLVFHCGRGSGFFRSVFLLPYALSFVVTGVVWRWIFTPQAGVNLLLKNSGISGLYERLTGEPLQPDWITSTETIGNLSAVLERLFPQVGGWLHVQLGVPMALLPVVFAASWQLSGFAMALFLAGMGGIPDEVYEAARVDGAGGWRMFWNITLPMLKGSLVVCVVLLAHVVLKCFDLVYAMVGTGPGFATDVPAIFVYDQMFRALKYNTGAAASIVMLVLVAAVFVPYLIRSYGKQAS
ncbi:MAG: sugar ABC transporter permease [Bifidobacteriaceae bacterium]|nr:sugar ABC transporter permease [Bifidobacteriaceae bacterium]